jgi:hypothetical protein
MQAFSLSSTSSPPITETRSFKISGCLYENSGHIAYLHVLRVFFIPSIIPPKEIEDLEDMLVESPSSENDFSRKKIDKKNIKNLDIFIITLQRKLPTL